MRNERQSPTLIEKELRFNQWCKERGIKIFLIDLDDTICATRQVFHECMSQAYDYLAVNAPLLSREEWKDQVEATNNKFFESHSVNPNRWNYVVDELAEKYHLEEEAKEKTKQILSQIYTTPLVMLDGVEEGLSFLKKAGVSIGIVTHANSEWTWRKYGWLNLQRYIKEEDICIVNENEHKTRDSWLQAIQYFGLTPKECVVVGDSPRSDINPARSLGVKYCFLVENLKQWIVHNQPVDNSVKRIKSLNQIIEVTIEE